MRINDKGEPIRIAGKTYEHGIFCFADSILAYPINGKYIRFEAEIGIEDNSQKEGSVFFSASNIDITLEAKEIYRQYPYQMGTLHAHSMKLGKNIETLLTTPDASIEKSITTGLVNKTLYMNSEDRPANHCLLHFITHGNVRSQSLRPK